MNIKSKERKEFISTDFFLEEAFISQFRGKQPEWDESEYIIYKTNYAQYIEEGDRLEEFWETLKRVIEGCFCLRKERCFNLEMPWNEQEAQYHAQIMFQKMWYFKFLELGQYLLKFSETLLRSSRPLGRENKNSNNEEIKESL